MTFFSRRPGMGLLFGIMALVCLAIWSAMPSTETTIEIRVSHQGSSLPDGFYVWHHLDANGIRFKSITPQNNNLLITFSSSAQSDAAKEVLHRALPGGYVIDQQDSSDQNTLTWLLTLGAGYKHA